VSPAGRGPAPDLGRPPRGGLPAGSPLRVPPLVRRRRSVALQRPLRAGGRRSPLRGAGTPRYAARGLTPPLAGDARGQWVTPHAFSLVSPSADCSSCVRLVTSAPYC